MTIEARTRLLRSLPAVDVLLQGTGLSRALELYGRRLVRVQVRRDLEVLRERILSGEAVDLEAELGGHAARVARALAESYGKPLERVLNATGIFLHTNLGRAPLPCGVVASLPSLLDAYCDLEYDLESGERIDRNHRAARLVEALTGAPAALVVNNNAAAMVLVLAALASGREALVSRGELVEIGGSFRIPELLEATGVHLVEVGTTNRTTLADYEKALGTNTALLLKVYPSNYRQAGYVASVAAADLVALGSAHGIPILVDEGSGLARKPARAQLKNHPSLEELMSLGCDLACGSGDKLLGGPQSGLLLGKRELVDECRRHPLYRALRPDRIALAALESVLRLHLAGQPLPLDRLWPDPEAHRFRLERAASRLAAEVVAADAFLGGGSAPDQPIPGEVLALPDTRELATRLRMGSPAVVGYSRKGRLVLDLRTVDEADDWALIEAVLAAYATLGIELPRARC